MKLTTLDRQKEQALIAMDQATELLKGIELADLASLWREEDRASAKEWLKTNECSQYYCYGDPSSTTIDTCYWGREGFDSPQLVLIFSAAYAGDDMPIWCCFEETHSVYYWVESDGTLTWAKDHFATKKDAERD